MGPVEAAANLTVSLSRTYLESERGGPPEWKDLAKYSVVQIRAFESHPKEINVPKPVRRAS
jgi:hypothetical protein